MLLYSELMVCAMLTSCTAAGEPCMICGCDVESHSEVARARRCEVLQVQLQQHAVAHAENAHVYAMNFLHA